MELMELKLTDKELQTILSALWCVENEFWPLEENDETSVLYKKISKHMKEKDLVSNVQ